MKGTAMTLKNAITAIKSHPYSFLYQPEIFANLNPNSDLAVSIPDDIISPDKLSLYSPYLSPTPTTHTPSTGSKPAKPGSESWLPNS